MDVLNTYCNDVFDTIAKEAACIARNNKKKTITTQCIQSSVALNYPQSIAKYANIEI